MADWILAELPGHFAVEAPRGSNGYLDEDGATFVLRLPTSPPTEVLISRHAADGTAPMSDVLADTIRLFFDRCIGGGAASLGASVQPAADAEPQHAVVQGVAPADGVGWWFIRAYELGWQRDYYWLQWCGPKDLLAPIVFRIGMSFAPVRGH
jgi:hypothetical protein